VCAGVVGDEVFTVNVEHSQGQAVFFDLDGFAFSNLSCFAQREKTARTRHKESPVDNDKPQMITSFPMKEHCSFMWNDPIGENFTQKQALFYDPVREHLRRDLHVEKRTQ
jgi:hypothetical protein